MLITPFHFIFHIRCQHCYYTLIAAATLISYFRQLSYAIFAISSFHITFSLIAFRRLLFITIRRLPRYFSLPLASIAACRCALSLLRRRRRQPSLMCCLPLPLLICRRCQYFLPRFIFATRCRRARLRAAALFFAIAMLMLPLLIFAFRLRCFAAIFAAAADYAFDAFSHFADFSPRILPIFAFDAMPPLRRYFAEDADYFAFRRHACCHFH